MSDTACGEAERKPDADKSQLDKPAKPSEDFAIDKHNGKQIRGPEDRPDPADPPE